MGDMFDTRKRSEIMSKVHNKNTTPEIRVRKLLHSLGYRFRLHRTDLPGNPDIVLNKYHSVVFVNGCFWHGCPTCERAKKRPQSNADYWNNKLDRTLKRDQNNIYLLKNLGWNVIVVWECETKTKQLDILKSKILTLLPKK